MPTVCDAEGNTGVVVHDTAFVISRQNYHLWFMRIDGRGDCRIFGLQTIGNQTPYRSRWILPVKLKKAILDFGSETPKIIITEFSDYLCFQCRKMHTALRLLVDHYPDRIRLIHRHFPMDHEFNPLVKEPFHGGSGKMALIRLYAHQKDKFWEINDLLFKIAAEENFNYKADSGGNRPAGSVKYPQAIDHTYFRSKLKHDIANGLRLA